MFSKSQISNLMFFLGGGPLGVSNRDPQIFLIRKFFLRADYWLSAAPYLKNNIEFEIFDPENMKFPIFKAQIAGIKVVKFF